MSPLNVHVNRFPISGTVGYFRHIPGEFLVAFDEKSSLRNERTLIGVENGHGRVLFKQIAGFIARRIVANVKVGDQGGGGRALRHDQVRFAGRRDRPAQCGGQGASSGRQTVAGETVLAAVP